MKFRAFEDRVFGSVATLVLARPWMIILCGAFLAIAGFVAGSLTISLNADTDDLISPSVDYMRDYRAFVEEFGDLERLWIAVDASDQPQRARECAEWIELQLAQDESLGDVYGGIPAESQLAMASRTMSRSDLQKVIAACEALARAATEPGVLGGLAAQLASLLGDTGLPADEQQRRLEGVVTALAWLVDGLPARTRQPLISESGRYIFVGIMPPKDYGTLGVIDAPLRQIRTVVHDARDRFPGIDVGMTGKPVLQADEMATSNSDMRRAASLAVVLVGLVIMIVLRTARRPILTMLAFACATGWTYGLVGLLVGRLNLLSIVFMLVLIGVGLDFGVHVISRYAEFRRQRGPAGSIRGLYATVLRGNTAAVLTSSATFFVAWFTEFQGLRELGVIAGLGLLLCYLAMATVLPSLLVITDRAPRPRLERLAGTDVDWADRLAHRPVLVVTVAFLVSILLVPFSTMMQFERNLLELQATNIESARWERRIAADSDSASWFAAAVVDSRADIADLATRARSRPTIGLVRSVNSVLGPPDPGRERLRARLQDCTVEALEVNEDTLQSDLAAVSGPLNSMSRLTAGRDRAVLADLVARIRYLEAETPAETIRSNLSSARSFLGDLRRGDRLSAREVLPAAMRDELISPEGRYLVKLHPREDVWDYAAMGRFIKDVRAVVPDVTGVPVTHYEALDSMREAFVTMMVLAVVLITIITTLTFRNLLDVIVCLLTLGIGLWWTVGAMAMLGVSFNLANFFAAPILVGLGIDGSLHMVHRWREGGPNRLRFGGTRRAVVLTSMTTMIGFGCLVIAEHRGLRSLGIVMALGSAACMIAVVVVLPSLLALRERVFRIQGAVDGSRK